MKYLLILLSCLVGHGHSERPYYYDDFALGYQSLDSYHGIENKIGLSCVNGIFTGYLINFDLNIIYYWLPEVNNNQSTSEYHTTMDKNGRDHCRDANGRFANDYLCNGSGDDLGTIITMDINKILFENNDFWIYGGGGLLGNLIGPQETIISPYLSLGIRSITRVMPDLGGAIETRMYYNYFSVTLIGSIGGNW